MNIPSALSKVMIIQTQRLMLIFQRRELKWVLFLCLFKCQ